MSGHVIDEVVYFMRRVYVVRNAAKRVADTNSSNISVRVLDDNFHRVFACGLEAVRLGSLKAKAF